MGAQLKERVLDVRQLMREGGKPERGGAGRKGMDRWRGSVQMQGSQEKS